MALLTRDGYIVSSDDFDESHQDELTVTQEVSPYFNNEAQTFEVFVDRQDGTISIPRYWGLDKFGRPVQQFGQTESAPRLIFKGDLRPGIQRNAVNTSVKHLLDHGGGVLSLPCGFGKSIIAIHIACSLQVKTLVVVHKTFLLDQWDERIKAFAPLARIGRVQQNIEDVDGCDIVVGMLQSIAMREYDDETFRYFGLVIFDEVHVVPAPVFSRALLRLSAPRMLGLSATPVRRDGLSYVIHWFIGPTFFEHSLTGKDDVTVHVVNFHLGRILPMNMVAATTIICKMEARNALIVDRICRLTSIGHKVILLSDRRAHCETLRLMLMNAGVEGALYLGGMKSFELKESEKRAVLLGTYSLAKEGLDIPSLDAIVLATPRSDVVQACGRILHGKTAHSPVVVDVVDQWVVGRAQFNKRKAYYDKAGFTVSRDLV